MAASKPAKKVAAKSKARPAKLDNMGGSKPTKPKPPGASLSDKYVRPKDKGIMGKTGRKTKDRAGNLGPKDYGNPKITGKRRWSVEGTV